jgi:hypothetical protein
VRPSPTKPLVRHATKIIPVVIGYMIAQNQTFSIEPATSEAPCALSIIDLKINGTLELATSAMVTAIRVP